MSGCYGENKDETKVNEDEDAKKIREREEHMCDLFYLFDKDRSGSISAEELSSVMVKFGGVPKADLDVMIAEADLDGDGQVKSAL